MKRIAGDSSVGLIGLNNGNLGNTPISNEIMNQSSIRDSYSFGDLNVFSDSSLSGPVNKKMRYLTGDAGSQSYGGNIEPLSTRFLMPNIDDWTAGNFPQTRKRVNPNVLTRRMAKPISKEISVIHGYEIGIMMTKPELKTGTGLAVKYFGRDGSSTHKYMIEDDILPIMNIATWNFYQQRIQYRLFKKNPEIYNSLDADEIWKHFTFEGVCRNEESAAGGESSVNDSYTNNPFRKEYYLKGDGSKLVTMVLKGPAKTYNLFKNSVSPGSHVYAIIKKFPCTHSFYLTPKINIKQQFHETTFDCKEKFLPFQMAVISLPSYARTVPSEYLLYYDEKGVKNYGKAIRLGTVLFQPTGLVITPPLDPSSLKPVSNAAEGIMQTINDYLTLIVDSDDGVLPL